MRTGLVTDIRAMAANLFNITTELAAMRATAATHPNATDLMTALQALQRGAEHGNGRWQPDGQWQPGPDDAQGNWRGGWN
jgi:hypothetical protein